MSTNLNIFPDIHVGTPPTTAPTMEARPASEEQYRAACPKRRML